MSVADHVIYGALWLSFGLVHSLLAGEGPGVPLRRWFGRYFRLVYNGIALVHILVVLALGWLWFSRGAETYAFSSLVQSVTVGMQVLGLVVLAAALLQYDLGRFSGTHYARHGTDRDPDGKPGAAPEPEPEPLNREGLNAHVRHPLYSGAFLVLWGGVRSEFDLATACWASLYLLIGSWFEERRLIGLYGQAYRDYQRDVPAFIPWKALLTRKRGSV